MKFYTDCGSDEVIVLAIDKLELNNLTSDLIKESPNSVWLISSGGNEDKTLIIVTEEINVNRYIPLFTEEKEVYFFKCETYEDAYIIARDMREGNILCYGG